MSKAKPQERIEKPGRRPRGVKSVPQGSEVYEQLLAELHARRVRLRKLLELVWTEASHSPAARPSELRPKCGNARIQRTA